MLGYCPWKEAFSQAVKTMLPKDGTPLFQRCSNEECQVLSFVKSGMCVLIIHTHILLLLWCHNRRDGSGALPYACLFILRVAVDEESCIILGQEKVKPVPIWADFLQGLGHFCCCGIPCLLQLCPVPSVLGSTRNSFFAHSVVRVELSPTRSLREADSR